MERFQHHGWRKKVSALSSIAVPVIGFDDPERLYKINI